MSTALRTRRSVFHCCLPAPSQGHGDTGAIISGCVCFWHLQASARLLACGSTRHCAPTCARHGGVLIVSPSGAVRNGHIYHGVSVHALQPEDSYLGSQARALGFYMFSRHTMISSAEQVDKSGHYPMHQPDTVVGQQIKLLLAWLGCLGRQKQ